MNLLSLQTAYPSAETDCRLLYFIFCIRARINISSSSSWTTILLSQKWREGTQFYAVAYRCQPWEARLTEWGVFATVGNVSRSLIEVPYFMVNSWRRHRFLFLTTLATHNYIIPPIVFLSIYIIRDWHFHALPLYYGDGLSLLLNSWDNYLIINLFLIIVGLRTGKLDLTITIIVGNTAVTFGLNIDFFTQRKKVEQKKQVGMCMCVRVLVKLG